MHDPVSSAVFKTWLPGSPERVWAALTCPAATERFLHGLSAQSTWEPGASITLAAVAVPAHPLTGTVLHAKPGTELAFSIEDASGTATFVSVTLRESEGGCVITLTVDESAGQAGSATDLEDAWLPVLERLRGELSRQTSA